MQAFAEPVWQLRIQDQMRTLLDNPFEGILAIDDQGAVLFMNGFFLDVLQCEAQQVQGKLVWDVIPGCRLFETVKQGYSIWGETLTIHDKEFLVVRFPLKVDGKIVGAAVKTLFPDHIVAKEIAQKLSHKVKRESSSQFELCTCRDIIGETSHMLYVKKLARMSSRTSSNLLITGESGTGKEVIAQAIHTRSVRREGPFVSVNCAAIPENLLESELFGYLDGAFTGARKGGKPGKFELADGGTILLDEVGDMPLYMQVKLLRVLQDREVWPIGGTAPVKVDVRVMASTNQDLKKMVQQNKFRQDLYFRLNVLEIHMPPLRERLEDLPLLVEVLIQRINRKIGSDAKSLTHESLKIMQSYDWPGNVRELENVLEQAIIWSESSSVDIRTIPVRPWEQEPGVPPLADSRQTFHHLVEKTEKDLIAEALEKAQGNKTKAAQLLNIQRSVLYKKIEKFGMKY